MYTFLFFPVHLQNINEGNIIDYFHSWESERATENEWMREREREKKQETANEDQIVLH